jgi:hypothetical protein
MACDAGWRYQRKTEFEFLERILYHVTTQSDVITAETAYVGHKGLTPPVILRKRLKIHAL